MRCLYIVSHHPISPRYRGGGSAIYYDQLTALHALGHDIDLWHYAYPTSRRAYDEFVADDGAIYQEVQSRCRSITCTTFPEGVGAVHRLHARAADILSGHRIANPLFRTLAPRELRRVLRRTRSELIWAQHVGPAQIAVLQDEVPVVYMHHDWLYRVKALANGRTPAADERQWEERVATSADVVVTASASESTQLQALGCRHVAYIPVAYDAIPWSSPAPPESVRLVHLGGLSTTANRLGLERFFEVVWPALRSRGLDFWVIGDKTRASSSLQQHLAAVHCTGFVADLTGVLRPYDIHIVPWEHDTGTRTRLPLVFGYGQAVVAVRAAVAGSPEAVNGQNCWLVDTLGDMAAVIAQLADDADERRRLGDAARATYERAFARSGLLPHYAAVLQTALEGRAVPA